MNILCTFHQIARVDVASVISTNPARFQLRALI
jgi:hypothetical protein